MNRRAKIPKPHQNIITGDIEMLDNDYSWASLTINERKKCKQKFDSFKPPSSDKISKYELQRMLREMGKDLTEEEILEKVWEADPKGQGYVSFEAFMRTIENQKEKKYNQVTNFIGLTFDSILSEQKKSQNDESIQEITWQYLKVYLSDNFNIDISLSTLAGKRSLTKSLNRNEFMSLFS